MKYLTPILIILQIALLAYADNVTAADIDPEVEACIRKNTPKATLIEKIRLTSENRLYQEEQVLSAKVYWKHSLDGNSNLLTVFDEPDDILGSRLLFLEKAPDNEIYLYMPALFKVRRISTDSFSSSMYGMDFSYEDFQLMYNMMSTADIDQNPDRTVDGKEMYVFAITPAQSDKSLYEVIYSYFDKKSCVIQKVEFYEKGKKLRKVLDTVDDSIKVVDGILVPHKYIMHDLEEESETELTVVSVSVDKPVKDDLFDPASLKEHRDIF